MQTVTTVAKQTCRVCGSFDIRPSYFRFMDGLIALVRPFEVFRCRACQHRFRVYLKPAGKDELSQTSGTR